MNNLRAFVRTFTRSLTDVGYYKEIAKAKFSFSLKYLFSLLFLISLIHGAIFAARSLGYLPKIPQFKENVKTIVRNFYPKELKITVSNNKIKTNVKEPYYIDVPEISKSLNKDIQNLHLITIDTKGSVENYAKYKTVFLVTNSFLVVPDQQTTPSYRVYPLENLLQNAPEGSVFDKKAYDSLADRLLPYLNYLPGVTSTLAVIGLLIWPFVGALFATLGQLFGLLLSSLILFVIAKLMKKALTYAKVYQLAVHGLTLPITASFIVGFTKFNFGFIFVLIFFVFMIIVISRFSSRA